MVELCEFIKDVVTILDNGILAPVLTDEEAANLDKLLRLTEEARRERHRRLEAGDESCRLKFSAIMQQQMTQQGQMNQPSWGKGGAAMTKSGGWPGQWPAAQVVARPGFIARPKMPPGLAGKGWGPSYGWGGGCGGCGMPGW